MERSVDRIESLVPPALLNECKIRSKKNEGLALLMKLEMLENVVLSSREQRKLFTLALLSLRVSPALANTSADADS